MQYVVVLKASIWINGSQTFVQDQTIRVVEVSDWAAAETLAHQLLNRYYSGWDKRSASVELPMPLEAIDKIKRVIPWEVHRR